MKLVIELVLELPQKAGLDQSGRRRINARFAL
jgi:hypothetical protein